MLVALTEELCKAKSRFQNIPAPAAMSAALAITVLTHGFFDFMLSYDNTAYSYLSPLPVVLLAGLVRYYVKQALAYDAKYIHGIGQPAGLAPATAKLDGAENTPPLAARQSPYPRMLAYAALYFLAAISFFTGAILLLGFVLLYLEKSEALSGGALPLIPMLLGLFLLRTAKKVKCLG